VRVLRELVFSPSCVSTSAFLAISRLGLISVERIARDQPTRRTVASGLMSRSTTARYLGSTVLIVAGTLASRKGQKQHFSCLRHGHSMVVPFAWSEASPTHAFKPSYKVISHISNLG
jgi:hypothetical protein